jgi:hypothetical protein
MAHGIWGMPHTFQGRADMVQALDDAGGTPSEYTAMHPENEGAQVLADGIGFGIGLGEYVYPSDAGRLPGQHRIGRLEWRDPRWLWRNPISLQWYYTKRDGMRAINPGDGQWLMFQPYPDIDTWRHGPWLYMTLAGIFERDSEFDRQRVSEVTTPTPVMRAEKATSKEARKQAHVELKELAHENRIVLPEAWVYEIVSTSGEYNDVTTAIVDWAIGMVEVGLTGNMMGTKAQSAFTDANVYKRTTTDRRRFYAGAWCSAVRRDGLVYWGEDNYADANVPIIKIDVESPEDKLAAGKALEQEGAALKSIREGAEAVGFDVDPDWVQERAQARGYRIIPKPVAATVARLSLGVDAMMACVRGGVALASLGLHGFGDERDDMTLAELANVGKSSGKGTPAPASALPGAVTPSNGPPIGAPALSPAPRMPDEECDPDPDEEDCEEDERRRALAAGLAGETKCYHGRAHVCPRCGVRRMYPPPTRNHDGSVTHPIVWRAILTKRAQVAA